ncbi:hypothetical protein OsJ_11510 [Oryza sativa Japonica Group]|uniref:Uncharacterized protein n=4 Tax=Oryza sativa subsp. japonica TaxID=39947 RepID=A3AJS4_ORYSJ|nr:hypothetical protein [Oryza sativa Japonica Group]ABF97234.1 hypothetical protein LOC_Os03g37780 [Oryza sativa Japonica Group]EAZ27563.1 hypothetical protein OsJ_11510 [Oryza sativa Japonica Group]
MGTSSSLLIPSPESRPRDLLLPPAIAASDPLPHGLTLRHPRKRCHFLLPRLCPPQSSGLEAPPQIKRPSSPSGQGRCRLSTVMSRVPPPPRCQTPSRTLESFGRHQIRSCLDTFTPPDRCHAAARHITRLRLIVFPCSYACSEGTFIAARRYASSMVPTSIISQGIGWQHDRNLGLLDGFPRLAAIWAEKKCKPQIMSLAQAVNEIARESLMLHWGFMSVCARLCGDLTFWCFADLSSLDLPVMEGLDKLLLAMAKGVNPEENGVMVASSTNGGIASQRQPIALRTPAPELPLQLPDEQQ